MVQRNHWRFRENLQKNSPCIKEVKEKAYPLILQSQKVKGTHCLDIKMQKFRNFINKSSCQKVAIASCLAEICLCTMFIRIPLTKT